MEDNQMTNTDFDRIAKFDDHKWDHNKYYHDYLLGHIGKIGSSMDIGCGKGAFAIRLADKSTNVIGIDLSTEMINAAKKNNGRSNIEYIVADVMEYTLGDEEYDCISSIATAHHLSMEDFLKKIRRSLKKGGVFLLLDLYKKETIADYIFSILAVPINFFKMLTIEGATKRNDDEIRVWNEHIKHDKYMTLSELRAICSEILPGSKVKRHFFWRYSVVWKK